MERALSDGARRPPNPFWSERIQEGWNVRMARPQHLPTLTAELGEMGELPPVPGGDQDPDLEVRSGRGRSTSRALEDRPQRMQGLSVERRRPLKFATPASWASSAGSGKGRAPKESTTLKSEGMMPQDDEEKRPRDGGPRGVLREEGTKMTNRAREHLDPRVQDDLERAMEREVFMQLQEENLQLRSEIEKLQQQTKNGNSSGWSEISMGTEARGPPRGEAAEERVRFTPNGTRVPPGPPPVDEDEMWVKIPPWPLGEYEKVELDAPCSNVFSGYVKGLPKGNGKLHDGGDGRGLGARQGRQVQGGFCDGGLDARDLHLGHSEVSGGGRQARGERHQGHSEASGGGRSARGSDQREQEQMSAGVGRDALTAAEAKALWLERELAGLKRALAGEGQGSAMRASKYWSQPFVPEGSTGLFPGEVQRSGVLDGDRAKQLQHGIPGSDRAKQLQPEDLRGDRVLHHHHAGSGGDRAWQPHHDGAGRDQAQGGVGGSTTATGAGGSQDQGGNHRTVELPELSGGDLTPLILGDWLEVVKPLMMDLSPQASRWWVLVVEESYKYYHEWRKATPMERLRIVPESEVVKTDLTLHRTEQRGISLLLKAIPTSVKETVIAERLMTTTGILFTLLKNFQPGGSSERTMLLKELSEIKVGKSPGEACAGVRSWRRFYTRTKEIDATVPDPIILLKALEPAVQLVSQLDAQATFRLAQSRAQLQVDARPEESSVWNYSECLLAELESLRLVHGTSATANNGTSSTTTPAVKMLGTRSTTTPACKFWGSDTGCRQGKRCSYLHDWASLEDRNNRCFLCSSTAHRKADCPTRTTGDSTAPVGGSGSGGGGGGTQKGKGIGKNKSSKGKSGGEERSGNGSSKGKGDGQQSQQQQSQQQAGLQEASLKAMSGAAAPSSTESVAGSTTSKPESLSTEKELMGEVASLLKSLRVAEGSANPQLSAIRLARVLRSDKSVLIDGGATHCLRNPHSREEYLNHAEEVRVDLAAGAVRMRQDTGTGTLYSEDPDIQPIVPLADVIKIGVVVKWDSSGCEMP